MFTLKKKERLTKDKAVEHLLRQGKEISAFPFRMIWAEDPASDHCLKIAFRISKKKIKRAVDRNRIRRRMREAFRQHKHILYDGISQTEKNFALLLIFSGSQSVSFQEAEGKIILILHRLVKQLCED